MASKIPKGPPGLEFDLTPLLRPEHNWPKVTGFYLEGVGYPNERCYLDAAQRYAEVLCPRERDFYVAVVAREAVKRVHRVHCLDGHQRDLFEPPRNSRRPVGLSQAATSVV
jgi:hypothetical protein